jgi:hypothetical protein
MSRQTSSINFRHSSFEPSLPASLQPRGQSRSAGQIEYCSSWLSTTLYVSVSFSSVVIARLLRSLPPQGSLERAARRDRRPWTESDIGKCSGHPRDVRRIYLDRLARNSVLGRQGIPQAGKSYTVFMNAIKRSLDREMNPADAFCCAPMACGSGGGACMTARLIGIVWSLDRVPDGLGWHHVEAGIVGSGTEYTSVNSCRCIRTYSRGQEMTEGQTETAQ